MSERRVAWLVSFVEELIANNWLIHMRKVSGIPWQTGLCGSGATLDQTDVGSWLFVDISSGSHGHFEMPQLVASTCICIRDKFSMGYRKLPGGVSEVFIGRDIQDRC